MAHGQRRVHQCIIGFQENSPTGSAAYSIIADANTQTFFGAYKVNTATSLSASAHYTLLSDGSVVATDNSYLAKTYIGGILKTRRPGAIPPSSRHPP